MAGDERVVDDGHSGGHARARYSLEAVSGPRRNVELKAVDPDPARTLALALALGASDEGVLVQRDTYFRVASGRLKLREEEPGEAHLIAYSRPDAAEVRVSSYRVVPVPDPEGMRAALTETNGIDVVVEKRRRLLLCIRIGLVRGRLRVCCGRKHQQRGTTSTGKQQCAARTRRRIRWVRRSTSRT